MDDKKDQLKFLYRQVKNDLINGNYPIEFISRSAEVRKTTEQYDIDKKTSQAIYELMKRTGTKIDTGTRAYYYYAKNKVEKFITEERKQDF